MLHGEMPFGLWRESELDTFAEIAKGQLSFPETFCPEAVDLITKVFFKISGYLLIFLARLPSPYLSKTMTKLND